MVEEEMVEEEEEMGLMLMLFILSGYERLVDLKLLDAQARGKHQYEDANTEI